MVVISSDIHNEISDTGTMASLYRALRFIYIESEPGVYPSETSHSLKFNKSLFIRPISIIQSL